MSVEVGKAVHFSFRNEMTTKTLSDIWFLYEKNKIVSKKKSLFETYKPVFIKISGIKMFGKHSFDLEKQFTFYASYHNNPINVLIHILCIWPILATGLVILQVRYYRVSHIEMVETKWL